MLGYYWDLFPADLARNGPSDPWPVSLSIHRMKGWSPQLVVPMYTVTTPISEHEPYPWLWPTSRNIYADFWVAYEVQIPARDFDELMKMRTSESIIMESILTNTVSAVYYQSHSDSVVKNFVCSLLSYTYIARIQYRPMFRWIIRATGGIIVTF